MVSGLRRPLVRAILPIGVAKMKKFSLAVIAFVLVSTVANAQDATAMASPSWTMVQQACGGEFRATKGSADRKTWQEFLTECKTRKGFVPKKSAKATVTLPDVVK